MKQLKASGFGKSRTELAKPASPITEGHIIKMPDALDAFNYVNTDLPGLKDRYLEWLKNDVYCFIEHKKTKEKLTVRTAKRGNREYIYAIKSRLDTYINKLPEVVFFNSREIKKHDTPCIYFVLTTNPKQRTRYMAWKNIDKEVNRFMSCLKRYFGGKGLVKRDRLEIIERNIEKRSRPVSERTWMKHNDTLNEEHIPGKISSIRGWECFYEKAEGYPHVNLVVYLHNKAVTVFPMRKKDKKGIVRRVWRVNCKRELEKYWHWGFIDVYGVSQLGDFDINDIKSAEDNEPYDAGRLSVVHSIKYLTKNIRGGEGTHKDILLNALLWVMRKRSFSLTNWFVTLDWIRANDNSNKIDKNPNNYRLLGIFPGCLKPCSKRNGGSPPPNCPYLVENREDRWLCPYSKDYVKPPKHTSISSSGATKTVTQCKGCGKYETHKIGLMVIYCTKCMGVST